MLDLFETRAAGRFHLIIYRLTLGSFALARHWDNQDLPSLERGRAFEEAIYRFCDLSLLPLSERAGSRTLRNARSASGMRHENDGGDRGIGPDRPSRG